MDRYLRTFIFDLSDKLELTLNARYDDAESKNTNYTIKTSLPSVRFLTVGNLLIPK